VATLNPEKGQVSIPFSDQISVIDSLNIWPF